MTSSPNINFSGFELTWWTVARLIAKAFIKLSVLYRGTKKFRIIVRSRVIRLFLFSTTVFECTCIIYIGSRAERSAIFRGMITVRYIEFFWLLHTMNCKFWKLHMSSFIIFLGFLSCHHILPAQLTKKRRFWKYHKCSFIITWAFCCTITFCLRKLYVSEKALITRYNREKTTIWLDRQT